jgi:hypothetical protein
MAKSYQEIEDQLRGEATRCLSMSQAATHRVEKRDWLDATERALAGRGDGWGPTSSARPTAPNGKQLAFTGHHGDLTRPPSGIAP